MIAKGRTVKRYMLTFNDNMAPIWGILLNYMR